MTSTRIRPSAEERMALYLRWVELSEAYDASVSDWQMKWRRFLDAYNGRIHELPGNIFGYESAVHPTRDFSRAPITSEELQILWRQIGDAHRHVAACFDAKWGFASSHEWSDYRIKPRLEGQVQDSPFDKDGDPSFEGSEELKPLQKKKRPASGHYWYGKGRPLNKGSGKPTEP